MARYNIYNNKGQIIASAEMTYNGGFMDIPELSCEVTSAELISFAPDDYVLYEVGNQTQRFILDNIPNIKQTSSIGGRGDAFKYNLTFYGEAIMLTRYVMCDVVPNDNEIHYTGLATFSAYCTVEDLCERIQANLDKYSADYNPNNNPQKAWSIRIDDSVDKSRAENFTFDNTNLWDAICEFHEQFDLNFTVVGREIVVGVVAELNPHTFAYGKGNGLIDIAEEISDDAIVTRLKTYGGTQNLPLNYSLRLDLTGLRYTPNLMIPEYFSSNGEIDYVDADAEAIKNFGIRYASIVFEDIYPTIEGVTVGDFSGTDATGRIDEVLAVQPATFGNSDAEFKIYVNFPFDLNATFDGETKYFVQGTKVSFKDGNLGGYEFELLKVESYSPSGSNPIAPMENYTLTLKRIENPDAGANEIAYLPDNNVNAKAGDHFVLIDCYMPEKLVQIAEKRLKAKGEEYLAENSKPKPTYTLSFDNIFLQKNPTIRYAITCGTVLKFKLANKSASEYIVQTLTISEGNNGIREYKVTLSDKPVHSTIDKINKDIEDLGESQVTIYRGLNSIIKRNFSDVKELMNALNKANLAHFSESINPITAQTMQLVVGSDDLQFELLFNTEDDGIYFSASDGKLYASAATLEHYTINRDSGNVDVLSTNKTPEVWEIDNDFTSGQLIDDHYYWLYVAASKYSAAAQYELYDGLDDEDGPGNDGDMFYFLVGMLNSKDSAGNRSFTTLYGFTEITPNRLVIKRIQTSDGKSFIDLALNQVRIGNDTSSLEYNLNNNGIFKFKNISLEIYNSAGTKMIALNTNGSGQLAGDKIKWDENGNITAQDAVFKNVTITGSVSNPFVLLRGEHIRTENNTIWSRAESKDSNGYYAWAFIDATTISYIYTKSETPNVGDYTYILVTGSYRQYYKIIGVQRNIFDGENGIDKHDNVVAPIRVTEETATMAPSEFTWGIENSGRIIRIINYKWGSQISSKRVKMLAPEGKYFFENGEQYSSITMSRETLVLLGYGDDTTFFGWIVLARVLTATENVYGRPIGVIYAGIINPFKSIPIESAYSADMDVSGATPNITFTKSGTGKYRITCTKLRNSNVSNWHVLISPNECGLDGTTLPVNNHPTPYLVRKGTEANGDLYFEVESKYFNGFADTGFIFQVISIAGWVSKFSVPVTFSLSNISSSTGGNVDIEAGSIFIATLTADAGYSIDSVVVKHGDDDVTSQAWTLGADGKSGTITIANVTALVNITASGKSIQYTLHQGLTHVSSSIAGSTGKVDGGSTFIATLTADAGYVFSSVSVYMDNKDITSQTIGGVKVWQPEPNNAVGTLTIAGVTGDVTISSTAVESTNYRTIKVYSDIEGAIIESNGIQYKNLSMDTPAEVKVYYGNGVTDGIAIDYSQAGNLAATPVLIYGLPKPNNNSGNIAVWDTLINPSRIDSSGDFYEYDDTDGDIGFDDNKTYVITALPAIGTAKGIVLRYPLNQSISSYNGKTWTILLNNVTADSANLDIPADSIALQFWDMSDRAWVQRDNGENGYYEFEGLGDNILVPAYYLRNTNYLLTNEM